MNRARTLMAATILALLLVAGAVGYAVASIPTAGRIYACYYNPPGSTSPVHSVQLLEKDKGNCPPNTTEVSWLAD